MPVEFLTDDEAAYGRYAGSPSRADLERVFFLDDEDMDLVNQRRRDHMKMGFALQLVTVRWLGTFLDDPLNVPVSVLEFVAGQLGVADPLVVDKYGERVKTLSDHQLEIRRAEGLRDFTEAQEELAGWVAAWSWTSGDGPKAIFLDAIAWMRERKILLPGVSRLARLVARVRDDTTHRLWAELEGLLTPVQRRVLDRLLEVPPGKRVSDLERWRKGPPPRGSGPAIIAALDQAASLNGHSPSVRPRTARRARPRRAVGPHRPATARPQRRHLAQLAHRRTRQALPDRLRPRKPLTSTETPVNDLAARPQGDGRPVGTRNGRGCRCGCRASYEKQLAGDLGSVGHL